MMKLFSVAALSVGLLATTSAVQAAHYEFNMSGSSTPSYIEHHTSYGSAKTLIQYNLTSVVDGGAFPDITLKLGDTVSGSVTMGSPVTLQASGLSSVLAVEIMNYADMSYIGSTESFETYLKGVPVVNPALPYGGNYLSGGPFGFFDDSGVPTPALTFDQVFFTYQVTSIFDPGGNAVSSISLVTGSPDMYFINRDPLSSVPEPTSEWLLLGGFALVSAFARRRSAMKLSPPETLPLHAPVVDGPFTATAPPTGTATGAF